MTTPTDRARALRRAETEPEKRLWYRLRNRQLGHFKFRRQCPIGPFVVDFLSLETALVVEVDGDTHAATQAQDMMRTEFIESQGFRVIRFSNHEVMTNMEGVLLRILDMAKAPSPSPRESKA